MGQRTNQVVFFITGQGKESKLNKKNPIYKRINFTINKLLTLIPNQKKFHEQQIL